MRKLVYVFPGKLIHDGYEKRPLAWMSYIVRNTTLTIVYQCSYLHKY